MSGMPTEDDIRGVQDVPALQQICLKIIRICEKESTSKKQYRNAASLLKSQVEELTARIQTIESTPSNDPVPLSTDIIQLHRSLTMCQSTITDLNCEIQRLSTQLRLKEGEVNQQQIVIQNLESQHDSAQDTIRLMEKQIKNGSSDTLVRHLQIEKEQLASRVQDLEQQICSGRDDQKTLKSKPTDDLNSRPVLPIEHSKLPGDDLEAQIASLTFENQNFVIAREETEKSFRATIEKNQARSKERLNRLKAKNRELKAANEEQQRKIQLEIDLLNNSLNEKDSILIAQEARLSKLNDISRERDFQLKTIIELKRKLEEYNAALEVNKRLDAEVTELREKVLQIDLSNESREKSLILAEQSVREKNATITNLRALLDKSVKSDERKQQQIEELQRERAMLTSKMQTLSQELEFDRSAELKPQQNVQINQFQQANAELETRNRKLQELLEKSNEVYAALREEHRRLIDNQQFDLRRFSRQYCVIFEREQGEHLNRKRMSTAAQKEAKLVKAAYLRRVVLQFFSQEMESERETMVPLILELVGCTQEQISVVVRHHSRKQQLIAKTSGLFGF
jgi:chromosome segregation ATPase